MSKKLLSFLISELTTVRFVCKNAACGMVVEMTVDDLIQGKGRQQACAFCQSSFDPHKRATAPITELARAIGALKAAASVVDVEFVLPGE